MLVNGGTWNRFLYSQENKKKKKQTQKSHLRERNLHWNKFIRRRDRIRLLL